MAKINILQSEDLRVEIKNNSKDVKTKNKNGTYIIEENGMKVDSSVNTIINLYVPKDKEFEKVEISTGASDTYIENLSTEQLELETGAGKVIIDRIAVSKKAEIDGGAGKVDIKKAEIKNLDIDCGIGEYNLEGKLIGNNSFECGVGSLRLNLEGDLDYYKFKTESGIGAIKLNNSICQNSIYGKGENKVIIKGRNGNC